MPDHYNLVYREGEREMFSFREKEDIGAVPWLPLAEGYLTRPRGDMMATTRGEVLTESYEEYRMGGGPDVNKRVAELAAEKGVTMAHLSLAWLPIDADHLTGPKAGVAKRQGMTEGLNSKRGNSRSCSFGILGFTSSSESKCLSEAAVIPYYATRSQGIGLALFQKIKTGQELVTSSVPEKGVVSQGDRIHPHQHYSCSFDGVVLPYTEAYDVDRTRNSR
ncbi:aldo/keto reductase [Halomicroarcula sp. F13]|uniref:Aldo/keto reductase n=1 Tax=Haloarcula rubra TaxID=2487747 RepID=A0AAW4PVD0_9EURY|nr:aldo/keto reductase [Halomicroarcula rubra]MBX0325127.1 aldo/keto reductase [Halomicroarcula rubra]